ncbi:MAG: hypothetical protein ACE5I3_06175 [Phycisphaerae bacterium]
MPPDSAPEPATERTHHEQHSKPKRAPSPWGVAPVPAAIALVAFALIFTQTRHYGLLGYDSYPIIVTSRVQSPADFTGNFTEKLMDGRYAHDFYRPLLNFSFALDYAIWRLQPVGCQLTNALLFAACAVALFALVRRLAGPRALIAPLAGMLFFLLHPTHFEVVPVPPRRADLLCGLWLALSLTCQLSPKALAMKRPPILPAVFGLLAIASKETGLILPALAFLAVLLYSPRSSVWKRALHAAIAIVPQIVVAAAMVAARLAVLGSLGGHRLAGLGDGPVGFPSAIIEIARRLISPQPVMQETSFAAWLAGGALLGLVITGVLMHAKRRSGNTAAVAARRPSRTGLFGILWVVLVSGTYVAAAQIEAWYLFLPVVGLAVFFAAATDALAGALRRGRRPARVAATVTLLLLLGVACWQARYSPFFQKYDEYERATTASSEFFEKLRTRIDAALDGTAVVAPPLPRWVRPQPAKPTMFGAAVLADYSVQAWAELAYSDRRIRVVKGRPSTIGRPASDELVVVLRALRRGFDSAIPQVYPQPSPR